MTFYTMFSKLDQCVCGAISWLDELFTLYGYQPSPGEFTLPYASHVRY